MLTTALGIILVIAVLVFVHESGHFISAKIMGVKVEKFSLGFGPKLLAKTIGDTEYRISLIPLGGYVKLAGEQMNEEKPPEKWEFFGKKPWRRAVILASGPFMNFFLAWVIFCLLLFVGLPSYKAVVGEVKAGEPAGLAGLIPGDRIISINGQEIKNWEGMAKIIYQNSGVPLAFAIERKEEIINSQITPRSLEELTPTKEKVSRGLIGILPDAGQLYYSRENFPNALKKGTRQTIELTRLIYTGIWQMLTRQISARQLGGPILIAQLTAHQIKLGLIPLLSFLAVISVNLAVVNLLPIPILDGGHLIFLFFEKIKGRPLSLKAQEYSQTVGLAILIAIVLFASYNDILRSLIK